MPPTVPHKPTEQYRPPVSTPPSYDSRPPAHQRPPQQQHKPHSPSPGRVVRTISCSVEDRELMRAAGPEPGEPGEPAVYGTQSARE